MAEQVVSFALQQLTDIITNRLKEEVNLVRGVKKNVHYLESKLKKIQMVLDDAEKRQFGDDSLSLRLWMRDLEYISYDIADVLDEWNYDILKRGIEESNDDDEVVPKSKCLCFNKITRRREIGIKIKKLKEKMAEILEEKDRYKLKMKVKDKDRDKLIEAQPVEPQKLDRVTTPVVDESEIIGRKNDKNSLVSKLTHKGAGQQEHIPCVISILGAGGIGKTALAQLVYNDYRVKECFGMRIWICVSNVSDELKIVKEILEQVTGETSQCELVETFNKLKNSISEKKFLLVLDDMWEEYCTKWERLREVLKCGDHGSKILITTRSEKVAEIIGGATGIHNVNHLNVEECWSIISRHAFSGREEDCEKFKAIGMKIAEKCKGLPLAAKVFGGYFRFKYSPEEWEDVLNNEIWQLKIAQKELFPHLILSYNELSPAMKRCFSYCAIFPKDHKINVGRLIRMWMALGYLSSEGTTREPKLIGLEYFDNLRMRSFFQCNRRYGNCKMHDIIHDFALFLRKIESHNNEPQSGDPSLVSNRIKVYRSFFCEGEIPSDLFNCAAGIRVLGLEKCGLDGIPSGIEKLIQLRYLDVRNNEFLEQIPQAICKLYYLETLYFADCCGLKEVPREIGKLIHLTHLDLSKNSGIKELPDTIYNLHNLITLNIYSCFTLERLPEGIDKLVNLRHFINDVTYNLKKLPEGLEQLTGLRTLKEYRAGGGWSKLGWLNKLDKLSGDIFLEINVAEVEDIVKAELGKKNYIKKLCISFVNPTDEGKSVLNDFLEALQPPPYLQSFAIYSYKGTKFPGWITSSFLNYLKTLDISKSFDCSALPPLGKLPCLEELGVDFMDELQFLNRDFLGIATTSSVVGKGGGDDIILNAASPSPSSSSDHVSIAFPKLRVLDFFSCQNWSEWEDITDEEEANTTLSIFPCLKELKIKICGSIKVLPHRLLRKACSLQDLKFFGSKHLMELYGDTEGAGRRSISHITRVSVDPFV